MSVRNIFVALVLLAFAHSPSSFASGTEAQRAYVSALVGTTFPTGTSYTNAVAGLNIGAEAGFKVLSEFDFGGYFNYSNVNPVKFYQYGAEASWYHYSGLNAGLKFGVAESDQSVSVTNFSFGPRLGYDFVLPSLPVSIGADASWMFVATGNPYSLVNLLAVAKVWF